MNADYCSFLHFHLADELSRIDLVEVACHRFGQNVTGYGAAFAGSAIFFRGHGKIVAVAYSVGDGVSCSVGRDDAELSSYESWQSLWELSGMTSAYNIDTLHLYLRQFPRDRGAALALVAKKLVELFTG